MDIYLSVAESSQHLLVLLSVGLGAGLLSGLFGIGGGVMLTPVLMLLGIPAPVAMATAANQVAGTAASGLFAHARRHGVDLRLGLLLLAGGLVGTGCGLWIASILASLGGIDRTIEIGYLLMLTGVGASMVADSARTARTARRSGGEGPVSADRAPAWIGRLPWQIEFRRAGLRASGFVPLGLGLVTGILAGVMGVGGGFLLVPALVILLRVPMAVVAGTTLVQVVGVSALVVLVQGLGAGQVDGLLAILLLVGGLAGVHAGAALARRIPANRLRLGLAALILALAGQLGVSMVG